MPTINKPKKSNTKSYKENRKERMKYYNSKKWKELREAKKMQNPLCQVCELEGKIKLADDIHHLKSFMKYIGNERDAMAFDINNLISLCDHHHYCIHHDWLSGCYSMEDIMERVAFHLEENEK